MGSLLSATGQCAMLKTYEDEMYRQLKSRFPNKTLCRVGTSKFNSIINSHRQNNNVKSEEEKSVEILSRQLKINEHITEAMDILDELSPLSCQKNRYEEYVDMNSKVASVFRIASPRPRPPQTGRLVLAWVGVDVVLAANVSQLY